MNHGPWRRRLLLANGIFLVVVGGVQVVFELAAYFAGAGPYGDVFEQSPYAIGWVEAHGLAFVIGVLLLTVAARDGRRFWHAFAARRPRAPRDGQSRVLGQFRGVRHGSDRDRRHRRALRPGGCSQWRMGGFA